MYDHPYARPASNHPESERYFADDIEAAQIRYAKPALSTWALEVTVKEMRHESNYLISKRAGLRVRASRKKSAKTTSYNVATGGMLDSPTAATITTSNMVNNAPGADVQHPGDIDNVAASDAGEESSSDSDLDDEIPIQELLNPTVVTHRGDDTVSWDLISNFSLEALEVKYKMHARVTWHVLSSFAERPQRRNMVHAVRRKNRPTNIVRPSLVSPVKYGWSL